MAEPVPRVGVAVLVMRSGLVLLGERKGSHGAGSWAFPGGHLEFGESVEQCAQREVLEETGLAIERLSSGPYVNDLFVSEAKHYVTLFVLAHSSQGEPMVREPDKCAGWRWCKWSQLPSPLFQPLRTLQKTGFVPPDAA